jgi:hypothetical protein
MLSTLANSCGGSRIDEFQWPAWSAGEDENEVSDHTGFEPCEAVIQTLASKTDDRIVNRKYSVSKQWGKILRANLMPEDEFATSAPVVVCWTGAGPGVQIFIDYMHATPRRPGQ